MAFFDAVKAYREGLLAQGFWALQIYRFWHFRYRFKSKIVRIPLGAPEIGNCVNIGAGDKVLGRIKIGNNEDTEANAVVGVLGK